MHSEKSGPFPSRVEEVCIPTLGSHTVQFNLELNPNLGGKLTLSAEINSPRTGTIYVHP